MPHRDTDGPGEDRAVLWDLDGVIIDSAPLHLWSWQEAFAEVGVPFSEAEFKATFGRRNPEIIRQVLGPSVDQRQIEAIAARKEELFRSKAPSSISMLPGVHELMTSLHGAGWKQAVASSAPKENVDLLLHLLGIRSLMATVVTERDVTVGKPAPDVFLLAAARLGIEPGQCVVIEDAVAGVEAARAAGMVCVAVTNTHAAEYLAHADLVVDNLVSLTPGDLARLLNRGA